MNFDTFFNMRSIQLWNELEIEARLDRVIRNRARNAAIISQLREVIQKLNENSETPINTTQKRPSTPIFVPIHNYAWSASTCTSPTLSADSLSSAEENRGFNGYSAKRKRMDEELEYQHFPADDEDMPIQNNEEEEEYPKQNGYSIVLGPNGTEVGMGCYSSIIWSSPASVTRQLLGFVFGSDILATHTLTGKPSPAFYGRERPPKMQLDPAKVADIIHCVRLKFKCTDREIRGAITTKCSDTSKKYKRLNQKILESFNKCDSIKQEYI